MAFEINLLDNASGEDLNDLAARVTNCRAFAAPTTSASAVATTSWHATPTPSIC